MNLIEKIRTLFEKKPNLPQNEYYQGENSIGNAVFKCAYSSYELPYGNSLKNIKQYVTLTVTNKTKWIDGQKTDSNLYTCELLYSESGGPKFTGYELPGVMPFCSGFIKDGEIEVIALFDLERMKQDQTYAKTVLVELFHKDRVEQLHDRFYKQQEEPIYGNYIGSIVELENGLTVKMDDQIGKIVATSSRMESFKEAYHTALEKCEAYQKEQEEMQKQKDIGKVKQLESTISALMQEKDRLLSSQSAQFTSHKTK